jgi:hypothetical protein
MAFEPSLDSIAQQNQRILTELGGMRDEMRVQTAMILRLDDTVTGLLTEL